VLLGAIALGRAWFGVALVIAYGAGMAVTLTGAGLVLVRARGPSRPACRPPAAVRAAGVSGRRAPVLTAICICRRGLYLALQGAIQI